MSTAAMKLLMIDNYDSFTYNLVQYFGELGADVEVHRNDEISVEEIGARIAAGVVRLVVSPGPCSPAEAGVSVAAIKWCDAAKSADMVRRDRIIREVFMGVID